LLEVDDSVSLTAYMYGVCTAGRVRAWCANPQRLKNDSPLNVVDAPTRVDSLRAIATGVPEGTAATAAAAAAAAQLAVLRIGRVDSGGGGSGGSGRNSPNVSAGPAAVSEPRGASPPPVESSAFMVAQVNHPVAWC
jgi:hypothetical protein